MTCRTFMVILLMVTLAPQAMANTGYPPSDIMRQNGMIYVVFGVLAIIFLGIVLYLWRMDRRLKRLENSQKQQ